MAKGISAEIRLEVKGLKEVQRQQVQMVRDLRGEPFLQAMRNATLIVYTSAVKNLHPWKGPGTGGWDTGRGAGSIKPDVRMERDGPVGVVGSNIDYMKYQEEGFKPHWVGVKHIGTWAERHLGIRKPVLVSGEPLRYLARALEDNRDRIFHLVGDGVAKIVKG